MKQNMQGGDNNISSDFYRYVISKLSNKKSYLNLGSGINFNFEKELSKANKECEITSIDILKPKYVPDNISFIKANIEESIQFDNKFQMITFFELIEHIDKTDVLIRNCYDNLENGGLLVFSFPNLASLYCRIELLLGFQPHVLEMSNLKANYGTGIFGKLNNPNNSPIHHIRGIAHKAMKEFIQSNGFKMLSIYGWDYRFPKLFIHFPSISAVNIFICKKD